MSPSLSGELTGSQSVTPDGARKVFEYRGVVPAPPAEVFPLLCPVREYEWIDDWSCEVQYTASGVAEKGCAFRTRLQVGESWICSRYEPGEAIQYVVWLSVGWMILDGELRDRGDGTSELRWRRTFTATTDAGRQAFGAMQPEQVEAQMAVLHGKLVAYLGDREHC